MYARDWPSAAPHNTPLQTDERVHASASLDELAPYLAARANFITPDLTLDQVLSPWAVAKAGDNT